jgi:hypothetical protein
MKLGKIAAVVVVVAALVGGPAVAANAATSASNSVSESLSNQQISRPTAAGLAAMTLVQPNYAAGAYYYVCIEPDGSTVTVLYHQKVTTQCKGAEAIAIYYESGQYVKTVKLTPSGTPGKHIVANAKDCILGVVGTVVLIAEPTLTVGWYISSGITGVGLLSCISQ